MHAEQLILQQATALLQGSEAEWPPCLVIGYIIPRVYAQAEPPQHCLALCCGLQEGQAAACRPRATMIPLAPCCLLLSARACHLPEVVFRSWAEADQDLIMGSGCLRLRDKTLLCHIATADAGADNCSLSGLGTANLLLRLACMNEVEQS